MKAAGNIGAQFGARMGQRLRRELRDRASKGDGQAAQALKRAGLKRPREGEAQRARPIEPAKRDAKRPKQAKAPERPRRPEGRAEAPDAAASHGSWAAARAKLEKERSQTFRGTKITFDD